MATMWELDPDGESEYVHGCMAWMGPGNGDVVALVCPSMDVLVRMWGRLVPDVDLDVSEVQCVRICTRQDDNEH